jgi:acyl-CoA synthetase (AMP-forming)/AMP-acid ligase II
MASTYAKEQLQIRIVHVAKKSMSARPVMPCVKVKIINEQGERMLSGEAHEIVAKNGRPGMVDLISEYHGEPVETTETCTGSRLRADDVGKFDNEGYLKTIERKKETIVSGGFNVYSREIETTLERKQRTVEPTILHWSVSKYVGAMKAFVVPKLGARDREEEVIEHSEIDLARYKKQSYVEFIVYFPRDAIGKVLERDFRCRGMTAEYALNKRIFNKTNWR